MAGAAEPGILPGVAGTWKHEAVAPLEIKTDHNLWDEFGLQASESGTYAVNRLVRHTIEPAPLLIMSPWAFGAPASRSWMQRWPRSQGCRISAWRVAWKLARRPR